MPILLLCSGDEQAKDLLRNTIIAHYGINPAGFDSVQLTTRGRVRRPVGPFTVWLSLELDIRFAPPSQVRQDYQLKFLKIPVLNQSEAFDSQTYYLRNRNNSALVTTEVQYIDAIKQRIWAYSAMLVMPLSETFVQLKYVNEACFIAHNTQTGMSAKICLYDNFQLNQIIITSDQHQDVFRIEVSREADEREGITFFKQMKVGWNDQVDYELSVLDMAIIDEFEDDVFQLE